MTLTSHEPVAQLVARSSGKISRLYVADGEPVCREQLLVVLENPAKTDDVLLLERELHAYAGLPDSLTERLLPLKELALGDIRWATSGRPIPPCCPTYMPTGTTGNWIIIRKK